MEGAAGVIQKGAEWVENNQNLVRIILLAALTLGGFLAVAGTCIAVVGGVGIVFTKTAGLVKGFIGVIRGLPDLFETIALYGMEAGDAIRNGFNRIRTAGSTAVTAMPGLIASVWSFTAALLANPITWVVVGIVALIAALILLWQNWDSVTAFLQNAWDTACSKITAGLEWLKQGFQSIMDWIGEKIAWFGEAGRRLVTTFVDGIKSVAMAPINAVKGIFGKISNLFPHSDAKEGLQQDAPKPVRLGGGTGEEADAGDGSGSAGRDGKVFIVKKLVLQVDVKKIKQLQDLLEIVGELEDKINSGEDPDDDPETDFALA